jgi:glycine cleavage system T protein (aminomethyltransferase)
MAQDGDSSVGGAAQVPHLDKLPLDSWHRAHGARMVPFAGYEMPVQYEGIIAEHLWTRESAGLFDVSHMGQLFVHGREVDMALEKLMPGDFEAAADMKPKYSLLLDDEGGIIDDLMATRRGSDFYLVVNGATKLSDIGYMERRLPGDVIIDHMRQQALLALQGPRSAEVLEGIVPEVTELGFMEAGPFHWRDQNLWISRSGYTGEDGFEISVPASGAEDFASAIVANELAKPIGLGARDSLRLEAGLTFAINKRRRVDSGFAGAMRILAELENGPVERRVGFDIEGRQPVREGALVLDGEGNEIGKITSGGFSPSLQRPIAMGYVASPFAESGTALKLEQRGKLFDARVASMPFVPHRYYRKGASA